jgi:hypothetical protein
MKLCQVESTLFKGQICYAALQMYKHYSEETLLDGTCWPVESWFWIWELQSERGDIMPHHSHQPNVLLVAYKKSFT